jgi:Protein of unknown function (DUF3363)
MGVSFQSEDRAFRLQPRANKRAGRDEIALWTRSFRSIMKVVTRNPRRPKAGSSHGSKKVQALASRSSRAKNQRVAVRVTYAPNLTPGHWKAHGRYIARDSASQPTKGLPPGFGPDGTVPDVGGTLAEWQAAKDPRLFKLIISPEFGERMDLVAHTKALMEGMAKDLNQSLDWVAVVHHNTDHPHVHIALRGVSKDGAEIKLPREYVQKGIRLRAEDLATAQLGIRTEADIAEAHRREVVQHRFTPLDRSIAKQQPEALKGADFPARSNPADPALKPYQKQQEQYLANRLRALTEIGLAVQVSPNEWTVRGNFADVLRTMQRTSDRQKTISQQASLASDPRIPLQVDDWRKLRNIEGRVLGHGEEEGSGKRYMLLEGTDGKLHYLTHTPQIDEARSQDKLKPDSFVTIQRTKVDGKIGHRLEDQGRADAILSDAAFLSNRAAKINQLRDHNRETPDNTGDPLRPPSTFGGWLGAYSAAVERRAAELRVEKQTRQVERDYVPPARSRRKDVGR